MPPPQPPITVATSFPLGFPSFNFDLGFLQAYNPYRWIFAITWRLIFWMPILSSLLLTAYLTFAIVYVACNGLGILLRHRPAPELRSIRCGFAL